MTDQSSSPQQSTADRSVIEQIADDLYQARRAVTTIDFVSPRLPEHDLDAAYRISELVATRREAQTIYYSLADDAVRRIIETLHDIYLGKSQRRNDAGR